MPDQVLTRDGPVAVPLDYTVPQSGELRPLMVRATLDGSSAASAFYAVVQIIAPSGRVMGNGVSPSIAAGGSADVTWFPHVATSLTVEGTEVGVSVETLFLDSRAASGPVSVLSSTTLVSGVTYVVVVEGTFVEVNQVLDRGSPEANAMFPSSTAGRVSTTVGYDVEVDFANYHGEAPPIAPPSFHTTNAFKVSLDGGATYSHIEPVGGPYNSPVAGHLYRYVVTGQGHVAGFQIPDTVASDNYGKLRITLQLPNGSGTGSGAGSLVPAADTTNNGEVLAVLAGVPQWFAVDGGSA